MKLLQPIRFLAIPSVVSGCTATPSKSTARYGWPVKSLLVGQPENCGVGKPYRVIFCRPKQDEKRNITWQILKHSQNNCDGKADYQHLELNLRPCTPGASACHLC